MCTEKVFIHAGVVGWKGSAIVLPGISGSGKTTLVTALVKAGATYYSDEYAVLDEDGLLHPYDRLGRRVGVPSCPGPEPLPVGFIVATHYNANALWQPVALSRGRAILSLIDNAVSIRRQPHFVLPILRRATSTTIAFQTARGEAEDVAPLILREIEKHDKGGLDSRYAYRLPPANSPGGSHVSHC